MQKMILASAAIFALSITNSAAFANPSDTPAPATTAELNAPPPPPTKTVIPPAAPGEPERIVTTYPGNLTPPPPSAFGKTYPLCTRTLQDNCRNPGEGEAEAKRDR